MYVWTLVGPDGRLGIGISLDGTTYEMWSNHYNTKSEDYKQWCDERVELIQNRASDPT
jgi:hypothetical protein